MPRFHCVVDCGRVRHEEIVEAANLKEAEAIAYEMLTNYVYAYAEELEDEEEEK